MAAIPSSVADRLAKASAQIRLAPVPADQEKAFMARHLVLATLPHRDPGNLPVWRRENGRFVLTVTPSTDDDGRPRHPYGSIPRLLLFWAVTEAARTKSRRLHLGHTLADFMRQVGLSPNTGGGKRGDARRLRDQAERLFRAQISFEERSAQPGERARWINMPITDSGEVWWSATAPNQCGLFESYVILGEAFFLAITAGPVPVDRRALKELRRSPLALDLYAWATYRVFSLAGRSAFVSWTGLSRQIGAAYSNPKNFQQAAAAAFRKIRAVYPGLNYRNEPGGIRLLPSLPAVPPDKPWKSSLVHGETVDPANPAAVLALATYPQKRAVKRYPPRTVKW